MKRWHPGRCAIAWDAKSSSGREVTLRLNSD
jgi:hypothetical protein